MKEFNKLPTRKKDKVLLDLWTKLVKIRANNQCERCGSTRFLNSHHVYDRTNYNVRYSLENGCCLCVSCHRFDRKSAHNAPLEFSEWIIGKRGLEWFEKLRTRAFSEVYKADKEAIYKELKEKVSEL